MLALKTKMKMTHIILTKVIKTLVNKITFFQMKKEKFIGFHKKYYNFKKN